MKSLAANSSEVCYVLCVKVALYKAKIKALKPHNKNT